MTPPKIVVEVGGGIVTNVYENAAVEVVVVDLDNIEAGDDPPERLRFQDGTGVKPFMTADNQVA